LSGQYEAARPRFDSGAGWIVSHCAPAGLGDQRPRQDSLSCALCCAAL